MKVGLLLQSFENGGVQKVIINLHNGFLKNGINSEIVVATNSGDMKNLINSDSKIEDLKINKFRGDYKFLFGINKIKKYINRSKPNIVVASPGFSTIALLIANKFAKYKTKTVLMVDNKISLLKKGKIKHKISYYIYKRMYKYADCIVVAHDSGRNDILNSYKLDSNKVVRIYHPLIDSNYINKIEDVNHKFFEKENFVIISVGRLVPEKNYDMLINIFNDIRKEISNIKLLIIGEGSEKEKLQNIINKNSLNDDVELLGYYEKPLEYMKKCNLYVLSSKQEAFGIVLVEALACGMQIVSTDCMSGGQREILSNGKYGYLCKPDDYDDLKEKILSAYNTRDNTKIEENIKRGLDFSINKSVSEYINVFRRLANE